MPRLHVLSDSEADRFDQPPAFNVVQRKKYFHVSRSMRHLLQSLRKPWTQVGFLLQWGYFRYTGRFFSVDRFQDEDIQFIIRHLDLSITTEIFRANYPSAVVYQHRSIILDKLGYHTFESKKSEFDYELGRLVAKRLRPKQICNYLGIEIPERLKRISLQGMS